VNERLARLAVIAVLIGWPALASGQTEPIPPSSLKGLLIQLSNKLASVGPEAPLEGRVTGQVEGLAALISLEVSTTPLGTSTGGLTIVPDKSGNLSRPSESFGPAFGKRSLTVGKGRLSVAFNALHARYGSIAGLKSNNWDLQLVRVRQAGGAPPVNLAGRIGLTADTLVGMLNYGLTEDIDVGVAIPWLRIAMDVDLGIFADGVDLTPGSHFLVIPRTTASGLGDIAVFGKYRFLKAAEGGLAAQVEVRLPSGDPNNFRGTGVVRTLASIVWSRGGRVSPHADVGYEIWSDGVPLEINGVFAKNQVSYGFGLSFQPHPKATLNFDVIGRRQLRGGRFGYRTQSAPGIEAEILLPLTQALDVISAAPGVKWNVAGNVLATGSVLLSIANNGTRAWVTPVLGFDWTF